MNQQATRPRTRKIAKRLLVALASLLTLILCASAFATPKECSGHCKASAAHEPAVRPTEIVPVRAAIAPAPAKEISPDQAPLTTEKGEMPASSPTLVTLYV